MIHVSTLPDYSAANTYFRVDIKEYIPVGDMLAKINLSDMKKEVFEVGIFLAMDLVRIARRIESVGNNRLAFLKGRYNLTLHVVGPRSPKKTKLSVCVGVFG